MSHSDEQTAGAPERIMVGVDGSASSLRALRWADRQARVTGADLHVVTIWSDPPMFGYVWRTSDWVDCEHETRRALDRTVTDALGAGAARVKERHVVHGHPTEELVRLTRPGDLLVVGSHGRRGFAGALLGSVSRSVVAHAPCPVVVVRGGGSDPVDPASADSGDDRR